MKLENPLFKTILSRIQLLLINGGNWVIRYKEDSKLKYALEKHILKDAFELYQPFNDDVDKQQKDIEKLTERLKVFYAAEQRSRQGDDTSPMVIAKNPDGSYCYTKEGQKDLDEALSAGIEKIEKEGVKRRLKLLETEVEISPYYVDNIEEYKLDPLLIDCFMGFVIKPEPEPIADIKLESLGEGKFEGKTNGELPKNKKLEVVKL